MDWQEILKALFGEDVAISDVLATVVAIITPIITVFFNKMRNKLIANESASAQKDKQITEQSKKIEALEEGMSYLANMLSTAYLSSNTIPESTKKVIGSYADKLDKLAGIKLTEETEKIITAVSEYVPNVNDKKEAILEATAEAEQVIDSVNEATKSAIDKLKL